MKNIEYGSGNPLITKALRNCHINRLNLTNPGSGKKFEIEHPKLRSILELLINKTTVKNPKSSIVNNPINVTKNPLKKPFILVPSQVV